MPSSSAIITVIITVIIETVAAWAIPNLTGYAWRGLASTRLPTVLGAVAALRVEA